MRKKTLAAFAVGVATVVTGVSSNVHADTTGKITKENIGNQTKISTTTTQVSNTQQEGEQAKQQAVVNNDRVAILKAQSKVSQDISGTIDAQRKVNQKQTALLKAQSSNNNIQNEQQSDANPTQRDSRLQSSAQSKINHDQNLVASQQKIVDQEQAQQLKAQQVNSQAQNNLIDSQNQVNQLQGKIIDDQNQIKSIQQSVVQDKLQISDQQQKVANDQQKINDDQVKINTGSTQFENDRRQLQNDQRILKSAKQSLASAADVVHDTKNQLNLLQSQSIMENQIKIPDGYTVSLLNQVPEGNLTMAENIQKQTINGILMNDHYKHNSDAAREIVNPNDLTHLSLTDQIELNQYTANLINSVRKQMGLQPLTVTNGSIKLAQEVAEQYNSYDNNNGWNICDKANAKQFPHDIQGLKNAAKQNNMPIPYPAENASTSIFGDDDVRVERKDVVLGDLRVDYSVDPSQWGYDPKYLSNKTPLTMDDLEENIYNTIIYMLFSDADSYFDHAKNFTEINGNMGVSFDNLGQLHIEFYSPADRGDLEDTPIPTKSGQSKLQQVQNLQSKLSQQQVAVIQAQKNVDAAQQKVNINQNKIKRDMPDQLQHQLSDDQLRLFTDMNILNDLEKQLKNDQQMLTQARNNFLKDQSITKQACRKLTFATQEATTAQTNLDKINDILINSQNKLNRLKQQLAMDQLGLSDFQHAQSDLQIAQRELIQAQTEYHNAVQNLNNVQVQTNHDREVLGQLSQKYTHDLEILNWIKGQLKQKERTSTPSFARQTRHPYTTAEIGKQFILNHAHRDYECNNIEQNGSDAVNHKPVANDNYSTNKKGIGVKTTTPSDLVRDVANESNDLMTSRLLDERDVQNVLPQMGNDHSSETAWGEVLLAIMSFFGILGLTRQKHRNL